MKTFGAVVVLAAMCASMGAAAPGDLVWSYATGSYVYSSPAVSGGYVFVGSPDNKVYCLDAATGVLVWSYATGSVVSSSPAVSGGYVYVGSSDHKVYCLDAATGALVWSYATGGWVYSCPAVSEGYVYVGSDDGKVYCLEAGAGDPGEWPKFRHDLQNTGSTGTPPPWPNRIDLGLGWNLIGAPLRQYDRPKQLSCCVVDDGADVFWWDDAVAAGLLHTYGYYYDPDVGYCSLATGGADDDSFQPARGYWLLTYQPGLALLVGP